MNIIAIIIAALLALGTAGAVVKSKQPYEPPQSHRRLPNETIEILPPEMVPVSP